MFATMMQNNMNSLTSIFKVYFKKNWGAPFIVGFMLLLIIAAFSARVTGLSSSAENMVEVAYYTLAAGVVLQVASFLRYRKNDGEEV